jgi:hypothetical protein
MLLMLANSAAGVGVVNSAGTLADHDHACIWYLIQTTLTHIRPDDPGPFYPAGYPPAGPLGAL